MSSDSDDFDESDEQELIALTEKYATQQPQTQATEEDHISGPILGGPSQSSIQSELQKTSAKYLEAVGEIAVLREKVRDIERTRNEQYQEARKTSENGIRQRDAKIAELEKAVAKLKLDAQFYEAQLKNPLRTKPQAPTRSNSNETIQPQKKRQTSLPKDASPPPPPKLVPRQPNYKALFLKALWRSSLPGLSVSNLSILSTICTPFSFEHEPYFRIDSSISIGSALSGSLVNAPDNSKVSDVVLDLCCLLSALLRALVDAEAILAVPFLLGLLHTAVTFRTDALSRQALISTAASSAYIAAAYVSCLDVAHHLEVPYDVSEPDHIAILKRASFIFALDVFEAAACAAACVDPALIVSVWQQAPQALLRTCLSKAAPPACALSVVMASSAAANAEMPVVFGEPYRNTEHCDKEYIRLLLAILNLETSPDTHLFFYGLNRYCGNNDRTAELLEVVPPALDGLCDSPYPLSLETDLDPKVNEESTINHKKQQYELKSRIIELLTAIASAKNSRDVTYVFSPECVKYCIEELRDLQEAVSLFPRDVFLLQRQQLIASIVQFLAPLLLQNDPQDPVSLVNRITAGVKRQMVVILTRIAFSSVLAADVSQFTETREKNGYQGVLFNEQCEQKARDLARLRGLEKPSEFVLVESEIPNGIEYGFGLEIVALSRDILEVCITPDEADNLYYAFVSEEKDEDMV